MNQEKLPSKYFVVLRDFVYRIMIDEFFYLSFYSLSDIITITTVSSRKSSREPELSSSHTRKQLLTLGQHTSVLPLSHPSSTPYSLDQSVANWRQSSDAIVRVWCGEQHLTAFCGSRHRNETGTSIRHPALFTESSPLELFSFSWPLLVSAVRLLASAAIVTDKCVKNGVFRILCPWHCLSVRFPFEEQTSWSASKS